MSSAGRFSAVSILLVLAASCGAGGERVRRPDVVLVVIDTLRADRLSSYGYERPTTPFLDRLASEGVLFEDATAQASWTLPSMVSLFTGQYLTAWRDRVPKDVAYLPQVFQQAGYRTVGLSANVLVNESAGFARGFRHFDAASGPLRPGDAPGTVRARDLPQLADALWEPLGHALEPDESGERPPLFLYLQPFDPHAPYFPHQGYDAELPPTGTRPVRPEGWQQEQLAALGPPAPADDPGWQAELRGMHYERGLYDQEVRFTDEMLARVFDRLAQLGVLEHAVVAVLADHGEGLWDHVALLRPEKQRTARPAELFYKEHGAHLYQEGVHTPFLLKAPGLPAGARVTVGVENVDLFPTLMELCDLAVPDGLDGRSLVPLVLGRETGAWRATVHSLVLPAVSVRELATDLKLILPLSAGGRFEHREPELYDLRADPLERTNLAPERPDDVARLTAAIDRWTLANPTAGSSDVPMDPEQLERLRQLGYAGEHLPGDAGGE